MENGLIRIHRDTFHEITERLSPLLLHGNRDGLMKIPVDKQLLIYIKYVSSQQTMQSIADLFGVCEATVYSLYTGFPLLHVQMYMYMYRINARND